jgi:hypothetical protein
MVGSRFAMFWQNDNPSMTTADDADRETAMVSYCGALADGGARPPPQLQSWTADKGKGVIIWTINMAVGACYTSPATDPRYSHQLLFFGGGSLQMGGHENAAGQGVTWAAAADVEIRNGPEPAALFLLQGRPIGEHVPQHGPFVMNSRDELQQAFMVYQRTGFGGWQWPTRGPAHARETGPFAKYLDGRVEDSGAAGAE